MNLRVVLLICFSVLNVGLISAFVSRPALAPPGVRKLLPDQDAPPATPSAEQSSKPGAPARSKIAQSTIGELWSSLHSSDLRTLVRQLRAAGFPPAMVRAIVDAEVERQFSPRMKELMKTVAETPYWRQQPGSFGGNAQFFEAVNQIYRDRSRVLRELLGTDAFAYAGMDPSAAQRRQYGNLPQAKIDLVQRINDDYAEMSGQVRSAMQGVTLPEDREKLALLEREKRADLAAVLTPEELSELEMRTSPITMRLRTAFTIMDASEPEFRAIYQAHEKFKDVLYPTSPSGMIFTGSEAWRGANAEINNELKATLGEKRFAQYQLSNDREFQQLYRLGQRDNIPYETLVRAHEARIPIADASIKIVEDASLNYEARRAAFKELADRARTTLLSTLGPTTGPAYVSNSRFLMLLEQGRGIAIQADGTLSTRSGPLPSPAAGAPKR
jgi:hypothetical protein